MGRHRGAMTKKSLVVIRAKGSKMGTGQIICPTRAGNHAENIAAGAASNTLLKRGRKAASPNAAAVRRGQANTPAWTRHSAQMPVTVGSSQRRITRTWARHGANSGCDRATDSAAMRKQLALASGANHPPLARVRARTAKQIESAAMRTGQKKGGSTPTKPQFTARRKSFGRTG